MVRLRFMQPYLQWYRHKCRLRWICRTKQSTEFNIFFQVRLALLIRKECLRNFADFVTRKRLKIRRHICLGWMQLHDAFTATRVSAGHLIPNGLLLSIAGPSIAEWEDPGASLVDLAPVSPVVQKVHWIAQLVSLTLIRGIAIYPVDSAIQLLNNWGLVVDSLSNAIERAKRAQQSLHYYRKWNYIMQENLVVTWPPVRPYVSPPLDGMLAGMKFRIDAPTRTDF